MYISDKDFWEQFGHFVNVIPKQYLDALMTLHEKLDGKGVTWVVSGDLAEVFRVVKVEADCIEITCPKRDAYKIFQLTQEFNPTQIILQTQQLLRNALINGQGYPVYVRSYFFSFNINQIKIKVQGDLQFMVGDWGWGDIFEFTPDYIYLVGKKTAVTPLSVAADLYRSLGWNDRVEKIMRVTHRSVHPRNPQT